MAEENFLQGYLRLNSGTEIPDIFALWCGISGISSVLGRRVYLDMGTYQIYPNFYIVLVAGSGRMRKSTAVGQIERLIRQLDPGLNIIGQKITPEALIEALRVQETDSEKVLFREKCEGVVIVDELATFLNKKSYEVGLAALLIPLWDCKESFEYRTKGRGAEKVTNSCLSLLGASTVDWIRDAIPAEAIGGGLTSRIIFVYVDTPAKPVAWTTFDDDKRKLMEKLVKQLQQLQITEGPVILSPEGRVWYEREYIKFYNATKFFDMKTLSGYASRRFVHLLKIAMIISIGENPSKVIDVIHLDAAKAILEQSEATMPLVLNLITMSDAGATMDLVYSLIRNAGKLSRAELLRAVSHKLDARALNEITETLKQAGMIQAVAVGETITYVDMKRKDK